MKTLLVAASAIGLLASTPAFAAEQTVNVSATVTGACGLGDHKSGANEAPGWTQGDINLGAITGADGKLDVDTVTQRSFGNVWCNGPADVKVEVSSLSLVGATGDPADDSSFANRFDMRITGNLGGSAFNNGSGTLDLSSDGATNGVLELTTGEAFETGLQQYSSFNLDVLNPGNLRPVAGSYKGIVRLTATIAS